MRITLIGLLWFMSAAAAAQDYPSRPIRLVVPFAAGGGTDISARFLAEGMQPLIGQTIVVDNRPGAGSVVGTEIAARSAPDGYTWLLGNISMAFNVALYKQLPYDTLRDFIPVSLVTDQPNILVAHPSLPAKSLKEFIALARSQPDKLTYGSAGNGSGTHLAMELLMLSQQLKLVHVPYKGTGPALTALLGNQISSFFSTFASALPHVKAGRLQTFGVTSLKRAPTLPEAPTIAEAGVPGYEYSTWYGLLVPGKTPRATVEKVNKAAVAALNSADVRQKLLSNGMDPIPSTPARYSDYLKSETAKWSKVIRAAKIPPL
jgi:tripartite-type tricarboxylate transporter receptor subunit TctC